LAQPARRLRGRGPALLPRRAPGAPGDDGDVPRAAHPRAGHRRHRGAAAAEVDVHQRDQAPAGGLHTRWGGLMDYPPVPVGAILAGSARRFADRTAVHYYGRDLTFAQLHARASAFAQALRADGIGRGDVVALHLPNCPQYAIAYYGTLMAGATFSPANPLLPPADLGAQLADCGAVAAVTWARAAPALAAVLEDTRIRLVLATDREQALDPTHPVAVAGAQDFEAFHADAPQTPPDVEIDVHADLAHIAYTGGTTGRSKGVLLPHRNVVVNTLQSACWASGAVPELDGAGGLVLDQVEPPEERPVRLGTGCAVTVTPWFHAKGTIGGMNVPVLRGDTLVLHDRFDPGAFLADAERFRVTSLGGAPPPGRKHGV